MRRNRKLVDSFAPFFEGNIYLAVAQSCSGLIKVFFRPTLFAQFARHLLSIYAATEQEDTPEIRQFGWPEEISTFFSILGPPECLGRVILGGHLREDQIFPHQNL
jgi:hypothetical protein